MRPLTVTLPDYSFRAVLSGEKRMIAARINGQLFRITRITGTPTEWRVYLGGAA